MIISFILSISGKNKFLPLFFNSIKYLKLFLLDADAPLVEQSKLLASYIEFLASLPNTNSINLVGLSKQKDPEKIEQDLVHLFPKQYFFIQSYVFPPWVL